MGTRQNKPGNRTVATIDPKKGVSNSPDKWFNQMKQLGHIPPKYSSLDELQIDVLGLAIEGKTDQEIATATGVDYKNVIGSSFVKPEVSSTGTPRGLAMRSAREDIKPDEQLYLKQTFGDSFYEDFQRLRELEWGDKKPSNGEDVEVLKERVYSALDNGAYSRSEYDPEFESAKVSADRARDQLRIAFGKNPGMAPESQVHRGHGLSALDGAGVSSRNLVEEWGLGNVSHGSAPRFDPQVLKMLNMSAGDLQALYDGYLTHRGLDINPQRYGGNYLAADESLRELKQGTTTGNPQSTVPVQSTKVSQDSIEWRDSRMEQLARQRAIELEGAGLSKSAALTQARTEMRDKSYQASTLFDTTQTTGGPVTSTKPELRKVGTVVTPGNENRTDQFGRPTRPSKATERPIFESTGQRVSTTQNLDLSNGTINFNPPEPAKLAMRANARKLALAGIGLPSVAGTAASAVETTIRTTVADQTNNPVDWLQAGLSGVSLAGDFVPFAGEVVSTPADIANFTIDEVRSPTKKPTAFDKVAPAILPKPKAVVANTPTGVATLTRTATSTERSAQARKRGGRWNLANGNLRIPELGLSELNPANEALYIGRSLISGKLPYFK